MTHPSSDIAFTPTVKAIQAARGSRDAYARQEARGGFRTAIDANLAAFLADVDTAYLATANAAGQPYAQHRGGPRGFIRVVGERSLAFADFSGNRQYISTGNLAENDRAFLFLMDYAHRRRIKLWGRARVVTGDAALTAATDAGRLRRAARAGHRLRHRGMGQQLPAAYPAEVRCRRRRHRPRRARRADRRTRSRQCRPPPPARKDRAMSRPPVPPFTDATAAQKARAAEDAWNSRDPARVALAYTPDSAWRNRAEFLTGRAGDRSLPDAQMGARARLPADQGSLGPCRQPHRRPLRL